eukprot:3683033-Lingulodinium_polyedra.AAC.1
MLLRIALSCATRIVEVCHEHCRLPNVMAMSAIAVYCPRTYAWQPGLPLFGKQSPYLRLLAYKNAPPIMTAFRV